MKPQQGSASVYSAPWNSKVNCGPHAPGGVHKLLVQVANIRIYFKCQVCCPAGVICRVLTASWSAALCCAVLSFAVSCCALLCCAFCCAVFCSAVLCCLLQHCAVLCRAVLCCAVLSILICLVLPQSKHPPLSSLCMIAKPARYKIRSKAFAVGNPVS